MFSWCLLLFIVFIVMGFVEGIENNRFVWFEFLFVNFELSLLVKNERGKREGKKK